MRNLILVLIAIIALATFITAYDGIETEVDNLPQQTIIESRSNN